MTSPQNQHTSTPIQNERKWLPRNQVYGQWDPNDDIVIGGVSGRFPESENVEEFMKNLYGGVNMVVESDRRWPIGFCNLPGCATLKDASKFDASYFGVPPKLVSYMDPQLRIILELTYEAIVDGGVNPTEIRGSKTGVYYALTGGDADQYFSSSQDKANGYGFIGSCKSMFANRISFHFDFTGPSFAVDTGCATSLVALNQAITDMRVCRVDAAIVCSSNLMLNPCYTQHLYKLGVLASVMEPRVFDANATGYVRGEAAVVFYLVRKSAARRVYANIVHVRNNTDGYKTAGIATPSGEKQYENNIAAYKESGVNPLDVLYVEAHGTGTKTGDTEELNSLADLFCNKRSGTLLVGSLKSNMGHAESTAGLCSMMKVVLAMQTGLIPPNLHFKDPNPRVPALFDGRMKVVDKIETLPGDYVGVNAFGLGGSNSHVVMKRHDKTKINVPKDQLPRLVGVSGRTEAAVNYFLDKIDAMPRDDDCIALLHEIHKNNISKHNYRGYTITNTKSPSRNVSHVGEEKRPVWFVCTGWGAQWMGQTKELMKIQVFERRIKMCSKVLEKKGINLYNIITKESDNENKDFIQVFLTIGATQLALIDLLRSIGIKPDALLGISTGEITCAYIDGAVTAGQVMLIAYHTAVWAKESNLPAASMAVVCGLTYEEVNALCPLGIYVAVHNDIRTCTVVGPKEEIPNFINSLLSKGIVAKSVKSSAGVAFHTPIIAKEAENLACKVQQLLPNSISAGLHWVSSSVHAENGRVPLVQKFNVDYFMNNVTETVLVQEALMHIPDNAVVVEISPHCALQLTLSKVLPTSVLSVPLMSRDEPFQIEFMLSGLGKMYIAGIQMNLTNLYPKVSFPVARGTHMINSMIQWEHSVEWAVPNVWYKARKDGSRPNKCSLSVDVTNDKDKYLTGHVVNQQPMFPHAGYLQLVWKSFAQVNENWFENVPVRLDNVQFLENTYIPDSGALSFVVRFGEHYENTSDFELYENNRILVSGSISKLEITNEVSEEVLAPLSENEPDILPLTAHDIYTDFRLRGFQYSGSFCSVKESDNRGTTGVVEWQKNWVTFLDSLFQFAQIGGNHSELSLPSKMKTITINPQEHLSGVEGTTEEVRVHVLKEENLLKGGGVHLQGLEFCYENKAREEQNAPEIEKQIFIPYVNRGAVKLGETSEECHFNALAVLVQIIQENISPMKKIKIVEFADNLKEQELLSPTLIPVMNKQPECKADITLLSKTPDLLKQSTLIELLHIKVEDTRDTTIINTDFHLVIGSCYQNLSNKNLPLCPGGFLLFEKALNEVEIEIPGFYLVAIQHTSNAAFILLREDLPEIKPAIVEVTNSNFAWLGILKGLLRINKYEKNNIFLLSEEEYQCGIMGFTKCLMREPGADKIRCVFLQDQKAPRFSINHPIYASQLKKNLRVNVYREGVWGTLRHINLGLKKNSTRPTEFAQVEVLQPGDLGSISWVETSLRFHRSELNEEFCHVYYASVNLKDALHASRSARGGNCGKHLLSQEFSGYNSSGERIMGIVPGGALATKVVAPSRFLWRVPVGWTLEQAASVPSAYLTGFYALVKRGRIQKGEWVLIHNTGSSVGQAAITICLQKDCNVIATVCNDHEQNTFRNIFHQFSKVHLVYSGSMEAQVMDFTEGRGVDLVFNTLETSKENKVLLGCLKDDGRFLDLALPQFSMSMSLGISSLQNKSYHSILVDSLFRPHNSEREEVLSIMSEGLDSGVVNPLPTKVLPETEIGKAFRYVMDVESSKKVIIKIHEETIGTNTISHPERKLISAIPKVFVGPEKVFVLAGGLGGFGMELAHWLILRGAKKLVLTSRRGVTVGYKSLRIRRWRESGIKILTSTQDITTEHGAEELLYKCSKLGPVGGIFILTMVLKDALLENQNKENFHEVCKAKVDVVRSLDAVSQRLCSELQYFVAFSSIASGRGNIGQSAYGMANSSLERICEERKMFGLPALAIQWGPIGDVGVVYNSMGNDGVLVGTVPQFISSCLDTFEDLLRQPHVVLTSHVLLDWELENSSARVLEKDILSTVANVLGIQDLSKVSANADVQDLGIDSLMSAEIRNTLQEQFSVKLSSQEIYSMMASTLKENSA